MKVRLSEIKNTEPKRSEGNIYELAQSIKNVGLICPLTLNQNYKLLAGRRRFKAVKKLGWKEVDCHILQSGSELYDFKVALEENLKRKPLTDVEVAVAIKEYDELKRKLEGERKGLLPYFGKKPPHRPKEAWTEEKTAEDLSISQQSVSTAIQIAKAVEEHPELVRIKKGGRILSAYKKLKEEKVMQEGLTIEPILKLGDFRELIKKIPDNSIDLILTDPPYEKKYLELWGELGKEAQRVLKPSKFLITYCGQSYLPFVLNTLTKYLNYYWLGMLYHKGQIAQRFEVNMFNRAKPIPFFYKPPLRKQDKWLDDVLISENPSKELHEWGQNIEPVKKLVECFSNVNDTILDPMFGGGSVIKASLLLKRRAIGFEKEKKYYVIGRKNLSKKT